MGTCSLNSSGAITELLERVVGGLGYELIQAEQAPRSGLLRVYIDAGKGIGLDDCAFVSEHLSRALAVEGVEYERLEVSSPGLDRPLVRERDFARFLGARVRFKTRAPLAGRRNFVGTLREVAQGEVAFDVEGATVRIAIDALERARLVPEV